MGSDLLIDQAIELTDKVLAHQNDEGDFLESDVYTYHFIEALSSLGTTPFATYINQAISWFEALNDPRDRNPRSFSPFKLLVLTKAKRSVEYCEAAVSKILRDMVGREGNINVPIGFVESPDIYDVFPTLVGVTVLIWYRQFGKMDVDDVIREALRWAADKLEDVRRPSTQGFFSWAVCEAIEKGLSLNENLKMRSIEAFSEVWRNLHSVNEPLQMAYLIFDAAKLWRLFPKACSYSMEDVRESLLGLLRRRQEEGDQFYHLQDPPLLDLRLLVAIGVSMTAEQRSAYHEKILASAFDDKVEAIRRVRLLSQEVRSLHYQIEALKASQKGEGLFIKPRWLLRKETSLDERLVFWLMPFPKKDVPPEMQSMERLFQERLRPTIEEEFGLRVVRADEIWGSEDIIQSTWEYIVKARVIVADLTGLSPNVIYEIGLADVLNKDIILLSQSLENVPLYLKGRKIIKYSPNYPGPEDLRHKLISAFKAIL